MNASEAKKNALKYHEDRYEGELNTILTKIRVESTEGQFMTEFKCDNPLVIKQLEKMGFKIVLDCIHWG